MDGLNATKTVYGRDKIDLLTSDQTPDAGLCTTCVHSKIIRSDRGSVFYRCELSKDNSQFPKYPRLPVLSCAGWTKPEPMTYCPRCDSPLVSEHCKLVCERCGYYMSCADYY